MDIQPKVWGKDALHHTFFTVHVIYLSSLPPDSQRNQFVQKQTETVSVNLSSQWFLKGGWSNAKREKEKGEFGLGSGQLKKLAHSE